jgi:1-Cys peroxiredoxin 6
MIDPAEVDKQGLPLTARAVRLILIIVFKSIIYSPLKVFFIGPDKKVKASLLYPATSGRNFEFVLLATYFFYF